MQQPKGINSYKECLNQMGNTCKALWVHVLNLKIISVGEDNNKQTDRLIQSSQNSQSLIKCAQVKQGTRPECQGYMYLIPKLCQLVRLQQTDRHTDTQQPKGTNSYKECLNKIGYIYKILYLHILNPKLLSVCEDNNRHRDRQMYWSQKAYTHTNSAPIKWGYNIKVLEVYVFKLNSVSIWDDSSRQTDRQKYSVAKRHKPEQNKKLRVRVCLCIDH